jgi:phosphate-selective porin
MRDMMWRPASSLACLILLAAGTAAAQTTYPNVKMTGRLQTQFYGYSNSDFAANSNVGPQSSNFFIRRARIEARGNLAENVSFFIQPNYTTGQSGVTLKDAYIDVAFMRPEAKSSVVLRVGQFKRFFGRYELTSATNLPSIERGAGRGLVPVASNEIAVANGFMAHDIGAALMYTGPGKRLTVQASVMNGSASPNANDINDSKSVYARTTYAVTPKLGVGASFASHEFIQQPNPLVAPDSTARNTGWGADAQWSAAGQPGLYVVADYDHGESTLNSANSLYGISVVAAYNIRTESPTSFLYAIEPALRYDFSEPNDNAANDQSTLVTAGVNLYVNSRTQIRLMYVSQSFEDPALDTITGALTALTMNF